MTVYIAICGDNAADRKHLERLLDREKDARLSKSLDVLYIDSFGSEDALLTTPIKYDIFLIDLSAGSASGAKTAERLRERGINAPIVLFSSEQSYDSFVRSPEDIIYLDKPVTKDRIENLVDVALDHVSRKVPLIEVRNRKDTRFISHDELIRVIPVERSLSRLCLSSGETVDATDSVDSLFKQCSTYGCFIMCRKDIVNICHIVSATDSGFRLSNGDIVTYSFRQKNDIIRTMAGCMHLLKLHQS